MYQRSRPPRFPLNCNLPSDAAEALRQYAFAHQLTLTEVVTAAILHYVALPGNSDKEGAHG